MQSRYLRVVVLNVFVLLGLAQTVHAQLNEHCTVAILNRTAQVSSDGTWRIDNVPAAFGPLRARATCVENGVTISGQSNLFVINSNGVAGIDADILNGSVVPIPSSLTISASPANLTQPNQTVSLVVTGSYADKSTKNLTPASSGTTYTISNTNLATITQDGVVTAKASGTVLVQAVNEGTQGLFQLTVTLSSDSDGDGIPDDVEIRLGLDPNNPADALDDPDHDGLSNVEEFRAGTDIHNADTDGDGLNDGQEANVFHTNPLLKDTDGDGVPDNIEVATGSDPVNPASFNLAAALSGIRAAPASFTINNNAVTGVSFQQLSVIGDFKLGGTIDLTAASKGTSYSSNNLPVCNFGAESGRVFGAAAGSCVITIVNSGFSTTATGTVTNFTATALSGTDIPGFANSVAVAGGFAYVAAGESGLVVLNVSDPARPRIAGSLDTPGNANNVRIVGNLAYVAAGLAGLQIIDVSNPALPVLLGSLDTPGEATDVMVLDNRAYVADGGAGLAIINVVNPNNPTILKQVETQGQAGVQGKARGVDLLPGTGNALFAIVLESTGTPRPNVGLRVIDVSDPATASVIANLPLQDLTPNGVLSSPLDIRIAGNIAYVASTGGLQIIDLSIPSAPLRRSVVPGSAKDIEIAGNLALVASQSTFLPILDVSNPALPVQAERINLSTFFSGAGTGITVKPPFVYVTSGRNSNSGSEVEKGDLGASSLLIAQYLPQQDVANVAPTVALSAPPNDSSVIRGATITLRAAATDDFAIASVTFQVNGVDVFTDDAAPYEALYTVPADATTLTVTARATDLGNNIATSGPFSITAIADPLTTVNGRVTRSDATGVVGARVLCQDAPAISGGDGRFAIAGLATTKGGISCTASFAEGTQQLQATTSPLEPVAAGVTDVGNIQIHVDQLTSVQGSIVKTSPSGLESGDGATIVCLNANATAGFGGGFSITGLPTRNGDLTCTASLTRNGRVFQGTSGAWKPIEGGAVNLGTIFVR